MLSQQYDMFNSTTTSYFIRKTVLCLEIWAPNESDAKKYFHFSFNTFKFHVYGMKLLGYFIQKLKDQFIDIEMGFLYDFI